MKMRYLLTVLIWLQAVASIGASAASIRIATYNLNWQNRRGDQILDAIAAANADIIFLQETTRQSERFLRERLAKTYPEFHAVGHEGGYLAERFAFASRIKLRDLHFEPPAAGLFGFFAATCTLGGEEVRIINVHLSPFLIPRNAGLLGVMDAIAATKEKHVAEVSAILASVNKEMPTIIAGDFNSISTFPAPRRLVEEGFIDSFASVHADADAHPTWQWPTRHLPIRLRIDYIFHSKHFRTTESAIIRRLGSDHFLVVSELELTRTTSSRVCTAFPRSKRWFVLPRVSGANHRDRDTG
jgi:endonuclease/exonuclease/phosphatase (EEP) superfamily protein YafD